jgi:hypothetical protein
MRIVHRAAADGIAIANIDNGAGTSLEHLGKILCRRNKASVAIDVPLTHEVCRDIGNKLRLGWIIDQLGPHVGQVYFGCRAKGCSDARSSAPHALLDLLNRIIAECPKRTADYSRLWNDIVGVSRPNRCHADDCRIGNDASS